MFYKKVSVPKSSFQRPSACVEASGACSEWQLASLMSLTAVCRSRVYPNKHVSASYFVELCSGFMARRNLRIISVSCESVWWQIFAPSLFLPLFRTADRSPTERVSEPVQLQTLQPVTCSRSSAPVYEQRYRSVCELRGINLRLLSCVILTRWLKAWMNFTIHQTFPFLLLWAGPKARRVHGTLVSASDNTPTACSLMSYSYCTQNWTTLSD